MDISNLMENVRSFFTGQYKGVDRSSSFIAFEPLGTMLDPSDFKDSSDSISDIKATEQLSVLSDRLPQINDIFLPNTGRLSTAYEMLIEGAVFTGAGITAEDKTPYIARMGELKAESLQYLEEARKASVVMPEGSYLPVYGYPKRWYDPSSAFWVNKTFSEKETPSAPTSKPLSPAARSMFSAWRTKLLIDPGTLSATPEKQAGNNSISPALTSKLLLHQAQITPALQLNKAAAIRPAGTAAIRSQVAMKRAANIPTADTAPAIEIKNLNLLKSVKLADRVRFTNELVKDSSTAPAPVHSNEFSMSFDYCIVYLERPWFKTTLFNYSNLWYCLSLRENYFSTGAKDESNNGILKCVPTAMILIKNLRIKAAWTDDDKANAKNSIGLGVFNLNDSTFSDNELVTPGMQVIGWICEVMPKLPAQADPNIK